VVLIEFIFITNFLFRLRANLAIEFIHVICRSFVSASSPVCEDVSVEKESAQKDGYARKQNVAQPAKDEELSPERGHG
jgi:hypothetical protein